MEDNDLYARVWYCVTIIIVVFIVRAASCQVAQTNIAAHAPRLETTTVTTTTIKDVSQ